MFACSPAIMANQQGSQQVETILAKLNSHLTEPQLSSQQQQTLLEQLKVLGRNPANSGAIFARDGVLTLSRYAFDQQDLAVAREASRCLANAMLLNEGSRQLFLDLGYVDKAVKRLESNDRDDEFLLSRIVFLLTYNTTVDLVKLVREDSLAKHISKNIAAHAIRYEDASAHKAHAMDEMALAESLKLLFNITAKKPGLVADFHDVVPDLFKILANIALPSKPLQAPVDATINALMNFEIPEASASDGANTTRLVLILERSIKTYSESELDKSGLPLVTLLRNYYTAASQTGKALLQSHLLPNDAARSKPLGTDDTLPSRLLRLSVSPNLLQLRTHISTLLFELSDSNPTTFIHNIGYGYAAGFLATNKIAIPEGAMENAPATAVDEDINPITGQRRRDEPEVDLPEMTEEEREREAERLYVLFERLRATGVVDVENPVHRARNEGRFEEVDD